MKVGKNKSSALQLEYDKNKTGQGGKKVQYSEIKKYVR